MKSNIVRLTIASLVPGLISAAAVAAPTAVKPRVEFKLAEPKLEAGKAPGTTTGAPTAGAARFRALTPEQAEKLANDAKVAPKDEAPANNNGSCSVKLQINSATGAAGTGFSAADVDTLATKGVMQQCQLATAANSEHKGQLIEELPVEARRNLIGMQQIALNKGVLSLGVDARDQVYAEALGDVLAKNDNVRPTQAELRERVKQIREKCNFNY